MTGWLGHCAVIHRVVLLFAEGPANSGTRTPIVYSEDYYGPGAEWCSWPLAFALFTYPESPIEDVESGFEGRRAARPSTNVLL